MTESAIPELVEFRVRLLERSLADAKTRITELSQALAGIAGLPSYASDPHANPIVIDANAIAPFASGFYPCEEDLEGKAFRWTGHGDFFEFRIVLNRNFRWAFAMEVRPGPGVEVGKIRAFVDYAEIAVQIDADGSHVRGVIPERPFASVLALTFHLSSRFIPSEADSSSNDTRTLSLQFRGLKIKPLAEEAVRLAVMEGEVVPLSKRGSM
jgi:hypothetical protein